MRPQFIIISIWMLTLGQCLTTMLFTKEDDKVININQNGTSNLKCCAYGNCPCSNLSFALEHIKDKTETKISSDISLHNIIVPFKDVSNVVIIGVSNPTVMCDCQGGLVGNNIKHIVIQGITWDSCNGMTMLSFTDAHVIECNFQLAPSVTIHGSSFMVIIKLEL